MQIHLYFDEDAQDDDVIAALRLRGVNVLTTTEAGMLGRDDEDQLAYAANGERTFYSFNVGDFNALHAEWITQGKSHAGIILAPQQRYSEGEQMRRLLKIINTLSAEQMKDRIEFLSSWG